MPETNPPESRAESPIRPGDSILDSIARRAGRAPRVNLRDAGTDDAAPIIDPKAHALQNELSRVDQGKYRVLGEIARGGMGVVLRAHDVELGRDVAMKVTDAELAKRPEVIERFVEEAQIGAQLQHPGIVPVYELGLMADERPYFTMKLIKGRTLAAMLTRRKSVEEDRVGFLRILESACQTMAYAHSKGVIHRDLKPANIMVGAFGEVQVVDWGLSKVLRRGGVDDEIEARDTALSVIETVRSGPGSGSDSIVGKVFGTPAYMSPEQAQGEPDKLDERTDVFALGAILCEILTGIPPYVAGEGENLVQKAALAELDDARARIEACSASQDLKKLCLASLLPARTARPRDAEELATAVHDHLAGLEVRAHEAQLEAAEGRLRAERARRRFQLTLLAGAVLVLAGGGGWWVDKQKRARLDELAASFTGVQDEAMARRRDGNFTQALEVARGGLRLVETGDADDELRERAENLVIVTEAAVRQEEERLAQVVRERQLFDFLTDIEMRQVRTGFAETDEELDAEYAEAFRAYGLDLQAEEVAERLMALQDTDLGIRLALGFDGWSRLLRRMDSDRDNDIELLTGVGTDLDTDPMRTTLRLALVERDDDQLLALFETIDVERTAPETLALLASSLTEFAHSVEARSLFVRGANQYPESFLLNYGAGYALYEAEQASLGDSYSSAMGYVRTAIALRPDLVGLHVLLGDLYRSHGNSVLALRQAKKVREMAPEYAWDPWIVGLDAFRVGKFEEALDWFERDAASESPSTWSASGAVACQIALGRATIEDYIAWAEDNHATTRIAWIGPALALCMPGFARLEPEPERVLAMLEPFLPDGLPAALFWDALAWAYVETGDAPSAAAAIERARGFGVYYTNLTWRARRILCDAAVLRLTGDDRAADHLLQQARWLRNDLTAGLEAEWRESEFVANFEYFETLAAGR